MNSREDKLNAFGRLLDIMDDLEKSVHGIKNRPWKAYVI